MHVRMCRSFWVSIVVRVGVIFFPSIIVGQNISGPLLEPYCDYLEWGTYDGQDWSLEDTLPASRYETFKAAFEHFETHNGKVIVELGTTRSFTHGGLPGCNSDNPSYWKPDCPETWDWGAGFFTRMAAHCLRSLHPDIHTVDIVPTHIRRCQLMLSDYQDVMNYHISDSVKFLRTCSFPSGIDLLYMDTGDMTPIEPTAQLQLAEARMIVRRNLIAPNGIIVIDDVRNQTPRKFGETSRLGKAKYSLDFFLSHGYEVIMAGYQYILQKKKKINP